MENKFIMPRLEEHEDITKKQHQEYITDLDAVCYYSNIPLSELCNTEQNDTLEYKSDIKKDKGNWCLSNETRNILRDKRKSRNRISKRKNRSKFMEKNEISNTKIN